MQLENHTTLARTEEPSRQSTSLTEQEDAVINAAAARILEQYLPAFQELAK